MPSQIIQGINVRWRDLEEGEDVLYADLPIAYQYFKRVEHPFSDDDLVAIATKEHTYTVIQQQWVDREKARIDFPRGVYAMIKGRLTYIPASYWGYINHWTLENGKKPDYREADRRFFLFKEHCCFNTELLAVTRGKGRRKGATSQGTYWAWWICGRKEEKIGGIVSYNNESASKIYSTMFMRGFKGMLPCFVEEFDSDSENFVRFVKPVEKKKKGVPIKREGLNSYIDYQPTTLNSYDSGRVSYLLGDEFGKWEKVDVNTYWSKVNPTLTEGDYKVGFAYIPTTVNPKKKGGENFRIFWDAANQYAINPQTGEPYGENTPSRVVQFFDSAAEGYAGCIDLYGDSVVEDPIEPVMGNDGRLITQGSLSKIKNKRALLTGDRLMEHRRDFPLDIFDLFAFETGQCEFNEANFIARISYLEEHPEEAFWRQGRWYDEYDEDEKKLIVKWADDPKGPCWINEFPEKPNNYSVRGGVIEALNGTMYSAGADTYKNIFAVNGSDGAISIIKKSCIVGGKETGLYPVFFFVDRPKLIKQFNRQVFLACLFFGCKVNYEIDAGTWFYEDFLEWNALELLEWTPAVDLTKPNFKIMPGTQSANPFELAKQLEVAKLYYDGNSAIEYNGNVHRVSYLPLLREGLQYNHAERTPYHLTVSFMMALLPMLGRPAPKSTTFNISSKKILPTYKIRTNQN